MTDADLARHLGLTPEEVRARRAAGELDVGPGLTEVEPPDLSPTPLSEEDFQGNVIALARANGWRVAHFRKARTKKGWRTAVAADGKGFTDLLAARERVVFIECKSETGRLSAEQKLWRQWLIAAGAEWYCVRPSDWDEIRKVLQ